MIIRKTGREGESGKERQHNTTGKKIDKGAGAAPKKKGERVSFKKLALI